jgi:methylenetetrahydrofolate dehydrogenase (NADP+)/methenyltetrahydrofolate cyclohydrolase
MTATLLNGRALARTLMGEIAAQATAFEAAHGRAAAIAVVQVGADPASSWYVGQIEKSFQRAGLGYGLHHLPETATAADLTARLMALNDDPAVDGIIVQLPLPAHLPASLVTDTMDPAKDVDGVHPLNAGRLFQGDSEALAPSTPSGGMEILRRYELPIRGRHAVVVGRSNIVGRPLAMMLLHEHATVTMAHSRTADLAAVARQADILAVAVGRPGLVTADMVAPGAVVLDFGTNEVDGRLVGDVDPAAAEVAGYMTPVPGGAGPMTNVMLLRNTLRAAERRLSGGR